jgi:hypothetical protein
VQIIQVTDPVLIAEALRSRDLDKPSSKVSFGLNKLTGPHALPMLLTAASDERWKSVRCASPPELHMQLIVMEPTMSSVTACPVTKSRCVRCVP